MAAKFEQAPGFGDAIGSLDPALGTPANLLAAHL